MKVAEQERSVCADVSNLNFRIVKLEAAIARHMLDEPVKTSFGIMNSRPAVFVRITDEDGIAGYGEIWCNFPACGAEHRAALFLSEVAPRVEGTRFSSPEVLLRYLNRSLHILSVQTGEVGPISQAVAGLDVAVWDLLGKRLGKPVYQLLGGSTPEVRAYGSGINPRGVEATVKRLQTEGYSRFKLKVGFGLERDLENVSIVASLMRDGERFMVDANQAWELAEAQEVIAQIEPLSPDWIEEPLAADTPDSVWHELRNQTGIRLAGGENYSSETQYRQACDAGILDIVQPDVCKWGGITGSKRVADYAAGKMQLMCPHSLGAGVALAASAHLLASTGKPGLLEVDGNPNPLRQEVYPISLKDGRFAIPDTPGLGVSADPIEACFV